MCKGQLMKTDLFLNVKQQYESLISLELSAEAVKQSKTVAKQQQWIPKNTKYDPGFNKLKYSLDLHIFLFLEYTVNSGLQCTQNKLDKTVVLQ